MVTVCKSKIIFPGFRPPMRLSSVGPVVASQTSFPLLFNSFPGDHAAEHCVINF